MRVLKDQTGVVAPSADYPNGNIANNLTLISEEVNGDIIQFFQKLAIDAGTSENGLPDNVTNGYQLIEAFQNFITTKHETWIDVLDADLVNGWTTETEPYTFMQYRKTAYNKVELRATVLNLVFGRNDLCFTMPVGFRPAKEIRVMLTYGQLGYTQDVLNSTAIIQTDGQVLLDRMRAETAGVIAYDTAIYSSSFSAIYSLD